MSRGTLALLLVALSCAAQMNLTGKDWRGMSPDMRLGYISGYIDGLTVGTTNTTDEEVSAGKLNPERVAKDQAHARNEAPFNLSVADIIDGLNRFYDEPANRNILAPDAIHILAMRVNGKSTKEVDIAIRSARETGSR